VNKFYIKKKLKKLINKLKMSGRAKVRFVEEIPAELQDGEISEDGEDIGDLDEFYFNPLHQSALTRGTYEERVASCQGADISVTWWKDNKLVTLASTYIGSEPAGTISRYDERQKQQITISCPNIVKEYNAHMG